MAVILAFSGFPGWKAFCFPFRPFRAIRSFPFDASEAAHMTIDHEGYAVGQDDLEDLLSNLKQFKKCFEKIGVHWRDAREKKIESAYLLLVSGQPVESVRLWELLPTELVCQLDDVSDILICDETGCLEQAYTDDEEQWDFCKKHGEQEQED